MSQTLKLALTCKAEYDAECEVPDGLTLEEAIAYAKQHIDLSELPADPGSINLLSGNEEIDENCCSLV